MKIHPLYQSQPCSFSLTLAFVWGFSLIALIFSFSNEFVFHAKPCRLCQLQRIPFGIILFLAPFSFVTHLQLLTNKLVIICLIGSVILGSWHFMIQIGWMGDFCSVPNNITNLAEYKKLIQTGSHSCATISLGLLGLPISAYNAALSAFFCLLLIKNTNVWKIFDNQVNGKTNKESDIKK